MAVFQRGWLYVIEESRRCPISNASPREQYVLNKFRIWKERHNYSDEGKPCQSPGRMKNSSYYILPRSEFELTTSRTL